MGPGAGMIQVVPCRPHDPCYLAISSGMILILKARVQWCLCYHNTRKYGDIFHTQAVWSIYTSVNKITIRSENDLSHVRYRTIIEWMLSSRSLDRGDKSRWHLNKNIIFIPENAIHLKILQNDDHFPGLTVCYLRIMIPCPSNNVAQNGRDMSLSHYDLRISHLRSNRHIY